ncbi:MAG: toxin-antitoxin system HicB family antitoxin [Leptolyngbyaceae cyanobacterium]
MNQLMLQLPDTLHKQLTHLAKGEGVSLDQFIVYALTRQVAQTYSVFKVPQEEVNQQQQAFESLLQSLGEASLEETDAILYSGRTRSGST